MGHRSWNYMQALTHKLLQPTAPTRNPCCAHLAYLHGWREGLGVLAQDVAKVNVEQPAITGRVQGQQIRGPGSASSRGAAQLWNSRRSFWGQVVRAQVVSSSIRTGSNVSGSSYQSTFTKNDIHTYNQSTPGQHEVVQVPIPHTQDVGGNAGAGTAAHKRLERLGLEPKGACAGREEGGGV